MPRHEAGADSPHTQRPSEVRRKLFRRGPRSRLHRHPIRLHGLSDGRDGEPSVEGGQLQREAELAAARPAEHIGGELAAVSHGGAQSPPELPDTRPMTE